MRRSNRWSAEVTRHGNALTLENAVFTKRDPASIARSLKRSAERSTRRKSSPFHSTMSMLNFYVNRMGRNLSPGRRKVLERAKVRLREIFGKDRSGAKPKGDNDAEKSRRRARASGRARR